MKRLIAIAVLTMLIIASSSPAQSDEKEKPRLLARAEVHSSSAPDILKADETIKINFESDTKIKITMNRGFFDKSDSQRSSVSDSIRGSEDISLLIKDELDLEKNLDLNYKSPSLKAEELPLVMSSKDKKTKGVLLPPFLYFKKQF